MAGPSGVIESGNDGESINPRTHKVNLGLDPNEMDLVEGWIEHVRELSRGHEDSDSDPGSWAYGEPAERVKDWYCLTPKGTHGPVITRHPSSIKHWRNQWLWAAGDWQCFPSDLVSEITVPQTLSHQRSSTLPKSGLAGLAAKRIHSVVKNKSSDNDQKKILAGLSLKGGEKNQDVPPAPVDPRQTILAPTVLP
ncbi:hypothetical protein Fot_36242 [Forsythia ovata]|uniref:Uncharacterized protein n=1 Tax=Forsythia ovata TaxID=205694 RepID=A0ABD1SQD6_9LAMI